MTDGSNASSDRSQSPDDVDARTDRIESPSDFERVFADALADVPAEHADESEFVPGVGPVDAEIVLVGEAPGADEVTQRAPFVGQAGSRLDASLDAVGLDRENVYITNVVKVRPPDNRTPRVDEIAAWRPVLDAELALVSPAVVVPLGNTATGAILDADEGITALHGERRESEGQVVVPTFHPAATFYDSGKTEAIEADLRTAVDAAR